MTKNKIEVKGFGWSGYERYDNYKAEVSSQDFTNFVRFIEGKMLTIADASFTDVQQRGAVKSLISQNLWNDIYENAQRALFQKEKGEEYPLG